METGTNDTQTEYPPTCSCWGECIDDCSKAVCCLCARYKDMKAGRGEASLCSCYTLCCRDEFGDCLCSFDNCNYREAVGYIFLKCLLFISVTAPLWIIGTILIALAEEHEFDNIKFLIGFICFMLMCGVIIFVPAGRYAYKKLKEDY